MSDGPGDSKRPANTYGERLLTIQRALPKAPVPDSMASVVYALRQVGAPLVLVQLVFSVMSMPGVDLDRRFEWVEYFAGGKAVALGLAAAGRAAAAFEILDDARMDYNSGIGFIVAVVLTLKLRLGGGSNLAPVCSTWVPMNKYSSGRSGGRPLGDHWHACVASANKMVTRVVLHCLLLSALGMFWVVEQPRQSSLMLHPRWQWLMSIMVVYEYAFNMEDYGSPTRKRTIIYSNKPWVADISKFLVSRVSQKSTLVREWKVAGKRKYEGNKGSLKSSQEYPKGFGKALAAVMGERAGELLHSSGIAQFEAMAAARADRWKYLALVQGPRSRAWEDAALDEVFSAML
jgi:hypothetical protein